jgi:excisionase family DNA binding protein
MRLANDDDEALCADGALTIPEAEALVRLSRASLYRLMDAGSLPYVQHGRRRLIPRRAAVRLLAAGLHRGEGT